MGNVKFTSLVGEMHYQLFFLFKSYIEAQNITKKKQFIMCYSKILSFCTSILKKRVNSGVAITMQKQLLDYGDKTKATIL